MEGLRLIYDDGSYAMDETWYTFNVSNTSNNSPWGEVQTIPDNLEIIGLKCETGGVSI